MVGIKRDTYIKKYVGHKNSARTESYKTNGLDKKKYAIKSTGKTGISRIVYKKYNDTTGYIVNGVVHSTKGKYDKSKKSKKQPWEK